ncbi:ATP-binding cassette domain-containing protein, partial [Acinetobacter baumannii]
TEKKPAARTKLTEAEKEQKANQALINRMGVDPEHGWQAHYEVLPGKENVVAELKKLAKDADAIYLATDLDREGEAIAWHLREVIGGDDSRYHRVVFNEITKNAIQEAQRSGKLVFDIEHLSVSYDGQTLIRDFSAIVMRGDRIGLVGDNGVGKTTLIKAILGEVQHEGVVKTGTQLEIAYFDQLRNQLDLEKSVSENVSEGSDFVDVNGQRRHILSYLQDFLFSPERARTPVKALSGGERNRVLLAKLLLKPSNLIVMDEPTNDLDMVTLELLEEMLSEYKGTLLLISHDRAFMDNVVTSTWVFDGKGGIAEYIGGYQDYLIQRPNERVVDQKGDVKKAQAKA